MRIRDEVTIELYYKLNEKAEEISFLNSVLENKDKRIAELEAVAESARELANGDSFHINGVECFCSICVALSTLATSDLKSLK